MSLGSQKPNAFRAGGVQTQPVSVPMPTNLGPNFYQQMGVSQVQPAGQGSPQGSPYPQSQRVPGQINQGTQFPWMGQGNGTMAPPGQSPQMQSPAPQFQMPPGFKRKQKMAGGQ